MIALSDWRPMRPNPLMPTRVVIASHSFAAAPVAASDSVFARPWPRPACDRGRPMRPAVTLATAARRSHAPASAGRADATSGTVPISPTSSPRAACTTFARAAWMPERGRGDRLSGRSDQPLAPGDRDAAAQDHRVGTEDVHDGDHRDRHGTSRTLDYDACDRIAQVRGSRDVGGGRARSGATSSATRAQDRRVGSPASSASRAACAMPVPEASASRWPGAAAAAARPVHVDREVPELARRRRPGRSAGARPRAPRRRCPVEIVR